MIDVAVFNQIWPRGNHVNRQMKYPVKHFVMSEQKLILTINASGSLLKFMIIEVKNK